MNARRAGAVLAAVLVITGLGAAPASAYVPRTPQCFRAQWCIPIPPPHHCHHHHRQGWNV